MFRKTEQAQSTPKGITRTFEEWRELSDARARLDAVTMHHYEQRKAWHEIKDAQDALILELRAQVEEAATRIAELEETIRRMAGGDCVVIPVDVTPEEARERFGVWPPAPGRLGVPNTAKGPDDREE
jgi:hypothetical protein